MFRIADAHCDTLYEIVVKGNTWANCVVSRKNMEAGNVSLQTFAMFTGRPDSAVAYEHGRKMLAASYELDVPIYRKELPESFPDAVPGGILSCEGGEMLQGSLERLAEFDDDSRLRMITLTWNYENEIGYPGKGGFREGLKPFGFELIREMDRRGILTDVAHLNDAGFWNVCETTALPVIATHSNCRELCAHSRNLTHDMIRAVAQTKGFIGVNFYSCFLRDDGPATMDDLYRHIDTLCEVAGEDVVGFGSDFDGIDEWPEGMGSPADFPALLDTLSRKGYTDAQLEKLAHANLWRVLKVAEAARRV